MSSLPWSLVLVKIWINVHGMNINCKLQPLSQRLTNLSPSSLYFGLHCPLYCPLAHRQFASSDSVFINSNCRNDIFSFLVLLLLLLLPSYSPFPPPFSFSAFSFSPFPSLFLTPVPLPHVFSSWLLLLLNTLIAYDLHGDIPQFSWNIT